LEELSWVLTTLTLTDVVDILIVSLLFFGLSFLFRGTQAVTLLRGLLMLVVLLVVIAGALQLQALGFLLTNTLTLLAVAIPVIFQPEIRRALEQIGRGGLLLSRTPPVGSREVIVEEIVQAAEKLAERRHGALIVLQRNSNLDDYIRTGVALDSMVKAELLLNVFWPRTELHDGAVIINASGRIASAAAVLPLTASRNLPNPKMGTRHRASLGISEASDAICVVVSEETGKIALTSGGRMVSRLEPDRLRTILSTFYIPNTAPQMTPYARIRARLRSIIQGIMPDIPRKSA
jgi:diadenylate cyclase